MEIPFLSSEEFDERAHRLHDAGEYDAALDLLREGLRAYPDAVELHIGLGYVRVAREEFAWARLAFEEALLRDSEHEDAWVGLGETLLKFGRYDQALECFSRVDALGLEDELEIGLAMGRALYREGLFTDARQRFVGLETAHGESAEVSAALGYTLHALGDDLGARFHLRRAVRLDTELHEARIYLSHLLYERGDLRGALRELERVPPAEHWDTLSLWRFLELKESLGGSPPGDPALEPWRERLIELDLEPDEIEHLLLEVEAAFEGAEAPETDPEERGEAIPSLALVPRSGEVHRVRTSDGLVFTGTWEEIVARMRDSVSDPREPVSIFMRRAAERVRRMTGRNIPHDDPEAFLRGGEQAGLLAIES